MGKSDLFGGAIWDQYSKKVADRMNNPRNMGEISEDEAKEKGLKLIVADFGAESCGDAVRLYWLVDEKTELIKKAKYKSFGCGTAIASSDVMVDLCLGKTVSEAVKITNIDVEKAMRDTPDVPAVPGQKMHCSVMAYDVIKKAASLYQNLDMDSYELETIVCECARVSLETIKDVIKINDLTTVQQITDYTKAGAFCKSCVKPGGHEKKDFYLVDILEETRREMDMEKMKDNVNNADSVENFDTMSIIKKFKAIEKVMDDKVRSFLMADGGNAEIVDVKEVDGKTEIYIRYLGACGACASSTTNTLYAIESTMLSELSENIKVFIV